MPISSVQVDPIGLARRAQAVDLMLERVDLVIHHALWLRAPPTDSARQPPGKPGSQRTGRNAHRLAACAPRGISVRASVIRVVALR